MARGPFRITVTERGQLDSMQNSTLTNSVEGSTTIIDIVPEGTKVHAPVKSEIAGVVTKVEKNESLGQELYTIVVRDEEGNEVDHLAEMHDLTRVLVEAGEEVDEGEFLAGDIVCQLDSSQLVDEEKQQQIQVTQAAANLEKAQKNVEIQKTQNESDYAASILARDLAQLDLKKYKDGDYQKDRDLLLGNIRAFQEELAKNKETYEFSKRNAKKGYIPLKQLEEARLAVLKTENQLASAQQELRVLEKYDYERQIKELEENAEEFVREAERVKLAGEAALAQFEAELEAAKLTHSVEVNKLERLQRQIAACTLVAPQAGEVVYANQQSRRSEPVVIEEGVTVRERQAIINLPDLTHMKVDARIHESKISQIRIGQRAIIRVDAFPDEVYMGEIVTVSSVPLPGSWPNLDLKEYEAEIRITGDAEHVSKLKPGLTAGIEIIVGETRPNVLQIPVQALITIGKKHFTYRIGEQKPERVELEIGQSNDQTVEILGGIEAGDEIVMNPRTHFKEEIEQLESEFGKSESDNDELRPPSGPRPQDVEQGGQGKSGANGAGDGSGGGPGAGGFDPSALFKSRDTDGDGKISREEAPERMAENFDRLDADGDGGITLQEFQKAMANRPPGGGGGTGDGAAGGGGAGSE